MTRRRRKLPRWREGEVQGREMNCIAHSRTRTQVEVASDSTVRDDSFVQFGSSGTILKTYSLDELSPAYQHMYSLLCKLT